MTGAFADARTDDTAARIASGERWTIGGALTFATAASALDSMRALPLPASGIVDCSEVDAVDSAAVAVLLALKRRASAEGRPLAFIAIPSALALLADLYGVREMLAG
jgi:phospholipid transport system transporter-binding protein